MPGAFLTRIVPVRERETAPLLLATAYGFCILFAHYIMRPVRDEISSADRGNLQIIWTIVFVVMLVAVPLYSWTVARWPRVVFIPVANRFFAVCLLGFWAALQWLPESSRVWIDRAFYVWQSVFALFVVAVFWGFMADLFKNDQGRRLFGFITVGSSLGAIAGASVTSLLAHHVPVFTLLLLAIIPLELSAWLAKALQSYSQRGESALRKEPSLVGGSALSGIRLVWSNPYLRAIAFYLALMTFANAIIYFTQADLVGTAITDRAARRAFLARLDLVTNILTISTQGLLAAWLIRRFGVGFSLALAPAATVVGFLILGLYPQLMVFAVVRVLYDTGRHALAKPAREVLFTLVSREERYKSKAFIDAAVYRGGDLVSGWLYAGLAALGLTVGAIALVSVPLVGVWALLGTKLGRNEEAARLAAEPAAAD